MMSRVALVGCRLDREHRLSRVTSDYLPAQGGGAMTGWWPRCLGILVLVAWSLPRVALADHTLTLGVFAYRPVEVMQRHFQPLADHLAETIPHVRIELRLLTLDEIEQAIASRQLDLLMTNPAHYIRLRSHNSLTGALATVTRREDGESFNSLGGVILARKDESSPASLDDLPGRRIGIAGRRFLGGYQAQAYKLHQAGIDVEDSAQLIELGSHDAVIQGLLEGEVDVGFVRSGILEHMASDERVAGPSRLRVINPQQFADFPYATSTRLYPEWPFIALPHVTNETVRQVAVALFSFTPEHPAARAAKLEGFAPPQDYLPVENLARTLQLPPFDYVPAFTWRDVLVRYRPALVVAMFSSLLVVMLLVLLVRRHRQLKGQHRRLSVAASVFSHSHEGIMITAPGGTIIDINRAFSRITGYPRDEVLGHSVQLLLMREQGDGFLLRLRQVLVRQGHWEGEVMGCCRDGEARLFRVTLSPVHDEHGEVRRYVGLLADITLHKQYQHELQQAAQHDVLTGLPNRLLLSDRLGQAKRLARRRGDGLGVVFIDLDGFKAVNDSLGHDVGDRLLVAVAERMSAALRDSDTLARLGGDEFVVVLSDLMSLEEAQMVASRLLSTIEQSHELAGEHVRVSASLGLVHYRPGSGNQDMDVDQLLRQADQAMYTAKRHGKNRLHIVAA